MAKHVGARLPSDLLEYLRKGPRVAVLATFSERGLPHTTPMQCIYPKDDTSLLMSIHKEHQGYYNMVWQKKVVLNFMGENNIAYSVLGRAGVVRAPSEVHPLMHVVRIDVIDVKSDQSVISVVESGIKWRYASEEARELGTALYKELISLAEEI